MNLVSLLVGIKKLGLKLGWPTPAQIGAISQPIQWNPASATASDGYTIVASTPPNGTNCYQASSAGATAYLVADGIASVNKDDMIYFNVTLHKWTLISGASIGLVTPYLIKGDNNGGAVPAVVGVDYPAPITYYQHCGLIYSGGGLVGANGAMQLGQQSFGTANIAAVASLAFSQGTAGTGITCTASVATFLGSASDVGRVITLCNGSTFTVTGNSGSSTTIVQGTLALGSGVSTLPNFATYTQWFISSTLTLTQVSGLSYTATFSLGTGPLLGTAADVGKVICLDGGKTATVTAQSSTTVCTVTLSATPSTLTFTTWTLAAPFTMNYVSGTWIFFSANAVFVGSPAAFYWTVMAATGGVYGTVYNFIYSVGGVAPVPSAAVLTATTGTTVTQPVQTTTASMQSPTAAQLAATTLVGTQGGVFLGTGAVSLPQWWSQVLAANCLGVNGLLRTDIGVRCGAINGGSLAAAVTARFNINNQTPIGAYVGAITGYTSCVGTLRLRGDGKHTMGPNGSNDNVANVSTSISPSNSSGGGAPPIDFTVSQTLHYDCVATSAYQAAIVEYMDVTVTPLP